MAMTGAERWRDRHDRVPGGDPDPGPEAIRERGRDARLSQAAIVLAAGAAVGGEMYRLDEPSALDLPEDLGRIGRQRKLRVEQAAGPLDIDLSTLSIIQSYGCRHRQASRSRGG